MLAEGCANTPTVLAAVSRNDALVAGVGTCEDPLVEAACPGGGKGGDVAEEGEARPSHFMANVGHLGGGNSGDYILFIYDSSSFYAHNNKENVRQPVHRSFTRIIKHLLIENSSIVSCDMAEQQTKLVVDGFNTSIYRYLPLTAGLTLCQRNVGQWCNCTYSCQRYNWQTIYTKRS